MYGRHIYQMNKHLSRVFSRNCAKVLKPLLSGLLVRGEDQYKQDDESGALLVEVLVASLILIIVFTTASIALASVSENRTSVEQRDRAISILSSFEEQSRFFRCGFAVDRKVTSEDSSTPEFKSYVNLCDFEYKYSVTPKGAANNTGDQSFDMEENIDLSVPPANSPKQKFHIDIRYWWETGDGAQTQSCSEIAKFGPPTNTNPDDDQPLILVRAFKITWQEKSQKYDEQIIKRDPVPADNVIFASGQRSSILVSIDKGKDVFFYPEIDKTTGSIISSYYQKRIIDGLMGQPTKCAWFPYLTVDAKRRGVGIASAGTVAPPSSVELTSTDVFKGVA